MPLIAAPGAAAAVSADAALDNVQKFYAQIQQVSALFRQVVKNNAFGNSGTSDGSVWIMKPGKMRWDYLQKKKDKVKVEKSFISNGTNLWMVDHGNMQIVKKSLSQDLMPVAVSFLYGKGDLKGEFTPVIDTSGKYGGKGEIVLKLTPKKTSAQYKNLYLVVSPTDFHVTQSIIIDSSDNVNHFHFFSPDFKKPIDAKKTFEFDESSPEVRNYRKVDADNQGTQKPATAPSQAPSKTPAPPATPPKK